MHRETIFHCTFASPRARKSALIPAWDAETAETLFRQVLEDDSHTEKGVIEVEARGRMQRRSEFSPDTE